MMRMRKFTLLLALVGLLAAATSVAQTPGVKGDGQVLYTQTFGWGNPADPKGWTAPEGYYFLDPLDLGYNWVWWPGDVGFVSTWTQDPPLNSTSKADGVLANFLEKYNVDAVAELNLDNSVVFPPIDCSAHSSVIVRFETHFMAYSVAHMYLEISLDDWVRVAVVDVSFGCGHKDRPLDKAPGVPAIFEANISDVCAGMPNVKMRLHWLDTRLYYWAVDDFTLSEAYNNDLKILFNQMEWDDSDENTRMAWIHNIPKTQLTANTGFMNFTSATLNFGSDDQEDVFMTLDITKGGNSVFNKTTDPEDVSILITDTAIVADKYNPVDFGHYKVNYEFKSKFTEDNPTDNKMTAFFNVTDSIYSRSDDSNDLSWSMSKEAYTTAATSNLNHFSGSIFPIFGDVEVSSISVFITGGKADNLMMYRFVLFMVPPATEEDQTPFELLASEMIQLDSSQFDKWITLELSKDGESEFLKKGDKVYAGISYDNLNEDYLVRRNKGLTIGTDNSVKLTESSGISIYDGGIRTGVGDYFGKRNFMIRLNVNDHSNLIDGIGNTLTASLLGQNYPNPFNGSTEIEYELANGSEVTFEVMDLTGRKVVSQNEGFVPAGKHTFKLNAGDLEAGVYFYTIKAGSFVQTKQMVVN